MDRSVTETARSSTICDIGIMDLPETGRPSEEKGGGGYSSLFRAALHVSAVLH